jgi:hypothetical protein
MKKYFLLIILLAGYCMAEDYFQQDVSYDIEVTLNDTDRALTAFEKLTYKNNSSDTLEFIWFHLWPNAYKSDSSAMAKQFIRLGSTRFLYAKEKNRGYIDSLDFSVDGVNAAWEYHSEWIDVAKVALPKPLLPGKTISIETPFFVKLPRVVSRLGHTGKHFEITQWYPKPAVYDKDGWHPMPYLNMGEFYSEFGTFDVKITLPENYRIMATGDMVGGEKELAWLDSLAVIGDSLKDLSKKELAKYSKENNPRKNKKKKGEEKDSVKTYQNKTIHFRQKNVHDFAWFADPNWIVQKGELQLDDSSRQITLWSMYLPKNAWLWRKSLEYLHDSGLWYSRFYGDYPYNHISAVDGDMSAGGGMEYPNITVISRSGSEDLLEYVIMHEVGHNWFYGILGTNERDHAWMDEGINEFTGIRYWEKKYSDRDNRFVFIDQIQNKWGIGKNVDMSYFQYSGYSSGATKADAQPLSISSDENYFYRNYGQNYSKVAVMMRYLLHYLGEEKIDKIMQDYYSSWKFKHPGPDDFTSFFDKHLDEDIDWFFDNLIDSTTYIDYKVSKKGGKYQLENLGSFDAAVELAFYDKNNDEIKRIWMRPNQKITVLDAPSDCRKVTIDPDQYMPDINRTNNTTRRGIKTHIIFDKPRYHDIDLNIFPWPPTSNPYDGNSNGIFIKYGGSGGFGGVSVDTWILYGDKTKNLNGILSLKKEVDNLWSLSTGRFESLIESRSGHDGISFSFIGSKNKRTRTSFEQTSIKFDMYYHNIKDIIAFNPTLYDIGEFGISKMSVSRYWKPDLFNDYSIGSQLHFGSKFAKLNLRSTINKRFSKKVKTSIIINAGTFLVSDKILKQYRYYLSGSIVPDFENYVWDRTADNSLSIIKGFYHGGGIRGINVDNPYVFSNDNIFTMRVDQTVPKMPGKLFFDVASGQSLPEKYYMASGIKLGPFIIPLYQSWEQENKIPNNLEWLKERIRLVWFLSSVD